MKPWKNLGALLVSVTLAGCGSSGDSESIIITGARNVPDSGVENPDTNLQSALRTLQWPADFPAEIRAGLTDAVIVYGLPPQAAYDFDVTLPESVNAENSTLFVLNADSVNQSGGAVCYGDPDCTGTVSADQVSIQLVSEGSGTATINIEPSSSPALINEGSTENPIILDLASGSATYLGTVGGAQTLQNQLIDGESYYRITNMAIGERYRIGINNSADVSLSMDTVSSRCNPVYSGRNLCVFVASENTTHFTVKGDPALLGASFSIELERVSGSDDFEGSWYAPLLLATPDMQTENHLGRSDLYSSYYTLDGLDYSQRYLVLLSGATSDASLILNSPFTGQPGVEPTCRDVYEDHRNAGSLCVIEESASADFRIESVDENTRYMVSIKPGMNNEGSQTSPLNLQYESPGLFHSGEVNDTSHYTLSGLTAGVQYLLQVYATESTPAYSILTADGIAISCYDFDQDHCAFTADSTEAYVTVTDKNSLIGSRFNLSLLPVDTSGLTSSSPIVENLMLGLEDLPHTGTVNQLFSEYTIDGLAGGQYYIASISKLSEAMSFAVWPNTSTVITCNITAENQTAGCLVKAGDDGQIRIRVGGETGGQYVLSLQNAFALQSENLSESPVLTIPDNSNVAVISPITITDNHPVGFIEVELLIDHGYTEDLLIQLEAPNGELVTLADHIPGSTFSGTIYSDLAAFPNPLEFNSHALQSYRPDEPLHRFHGIDSAGIWQLHVTDDADTNRSDALGGALLSWGLTLGSDTLRADF